MTSITCPQCGLSYTPSSAPSGMCPRCLLLGGAEDETLLTGTPSLEELREAVPGFTVEALLGRGGMGAVYRARQLDLDRDVAIKFVVTSRLDPSFGERFEREARVLARLNHPNIVAVHRYGRTDDGLAYIVMEYVEGSDLAQLIASGRIPEAQALPLVEQICAALAYAHTAGCVHRDIKPGNILLDRAGRVKVADFGLAKLLDDTAAPGLPLASALTLSFVGVGTAHYAAPEQTKAGATVDHRADIYALGVVLCEMLTGEVPRGVFKNPSEKSGAHQCWDTMILRAMNERPEERFGTMGDVSRELARVRRQMEPRPRWKTPVLITAGVMMLATLLTLAFLAFSHWPKNTNNAAPFQNGSFEDIHNGSPVGWTISGSVHPYIRESGKPAVACFGAGEAPADGILSQSFATVTGRRYQVRFNWKSTGGPDVRASQRLRVSVREGQGLNGPDLMTPGSARLNGVDDERILLNGTAALFSDRPVANPKGLYTEGALGFTARSAVSTLIFEDKSLSSVSADIFLDVVRISAAP